MNYVVIMKKQAQKKLRRIRGVERERIVEKICFLGQDPDDVRLDVKKLAGEPYHRLRVGNWRIIFDRDDGVKIIAIEKIKPRGDVYK